MDRKIYENQLSSLLPEHDELDENYEVEAYRQEQVAEAAANKEAKLNAATLARMKMREKYELEKAEKQKTGYHRIISAKGCSACEVRLWEIML